MTNEWQIISIFICATKTKKREIANIEFIYLYKGKLIVIVVIIAIFHLISLIFCSFCDLYVQKKPVISLMVILLLIFSVLLSISRFPLFLFFME